MRAPRHDAAHEAALFFLAGQVSQHWGRSNASGPNQCGCFHGFSAAQFHSIAGKAEHASTGLNLDFPLAELKAQALAEFGENHRPGMDKEEANPVRVELRVRFHRFPDKIVQRPHRLDAGETTTCYHERQHGGRTLSLSSRFTNRQWTLLEMCRHRERARYLLDQSRTLGFSLAQHEDFRRPMMDAASSRLVFRATSIGRTQFRFDQPLVAL